MVNLIPVSAIAQDYWRGQRLFLAHCDACHDSLTYPGKQQKVKSLAELKGRIESWAIHGGENWGQSEIDDVTYYLNKSHYHFDETNH